MNWTMKVTPLVVFILFIIAGLYDLGMVVFAGTGSSISAFMVRMGISAPFPVFVFGLIMGHFFFRMIPAPIDKEKKEV